MSFAVAGLRVPGVVIENPECVSKTFPGFFDRLADLATPFEVVVANLYSDLLVSHAPQLEAALGPSGWLCVSGLNATREEAVTDAFSAVGLRVSSRSARGVWRALVLERG